MTQIYNVYCDESCHLENDPCKVMVLGAIWCPQDKTHEISLRLREIKTEHNLSGTFETKWTKVSPAQISFYRSLINLFFDNENLHFRALIVPDKSRLNHQAFNQNHEEWYYKMYFEMLRAILMPDAKYKIFLDYKDTHSGTRVAKLDQVLRNSLYDFSRDILLQTQVVRSHEVEILQLTDLLVGLVGYTNREANTSEAKNSLVDLMRRKSHYSLTRSTLLRENKVNLFRWQAAEVTG